ncbi:MAG: hypothetical protein KAX13_04265, partial [Candidatus Krumholzibacteria bacterium]|nr:hypothetical protein [Candidatus Krumholzibacteria bacterium]
MKIIQRIKDFAKRRPGLAQLVFTTAIIMLGFLIFAGFMATRSDVKRSRANLPPPLVNVIAADVGPSGVLVTGEGT